MLFKSYIPPIKDIATILSITVQSFVWDDNLRAIQVTQVISWGLSNHPTSFGKHILVLWLSVLGFFLLIPVFIVFDGGYEATPLQAVRVPLPVGGSILCQGGRC